MAWLEKALDPYHDTELDVRGLPDEDTSKVVVQEVNFSQVISAPASSGTGNWDCNIAILPEIETSAYSGRLVTSQSGVDGGASIANFQNINLGLVTAMSVPSGDATYPTTAAPNPAVAPVATVVDFSGYNPGQRRIIALAFEVYNTTSDLNAQGDVTVYRQPQSVEDMMINPVSNGTQAAIFSKVSRLPPGTFNLALSQPGSKTWKARDGAYCVGVMDLRNNRLTGGSWCMRAFTPGDVGYATPSTATQPIVESPLSYGGTLYAASASAGLPTTAIAFQSPSNSFKPTAFHTTGAYFTGLSATSTLRLVVRALFEVSPAADNLALVPMAKPSPFYDPVALDIYKMVAAQMPPGCPVADNASGDFWDRCLGFLSKAAPVVGGLFGPTGAAIGAAAGAGLSGIQARRNNVPAAPAPKVERQIQSLQQQLASVKLRDSMARMKPGKLTAAEERALEQRLAKQRKK